MAYNLEFDSGYQFARSRIIFNNSKPVVAKQPDYSIRYLYNCARWVVISNSLVAYWPISLNLKGILIEKSGTSERVETLLSIPRLIVSLVYAVLNVTAAVGYAAQKSPETSTFNKLLMYTWGFVLCLTATLNRFFSIYKIPAFTQFWAHLEKVSLQCEKISTENRFRSGLTSIQKKTRNLFGVLAVLGICNVCSAIHHFATKADISGAHRAIGIYYEMISCMHTCNTLVLFFFIKVHAFLFEVISEKLEEMGGENTGESSSVSAELNSIVPIVDDLEDCVGLFNGVFGFGLMADLILVFTHVLFPLFWLHEQGEFGSIVVTFVVPTVMYLICLFSLCKGSNSMEVACKQMTRVFQSLPHDMLSRNDTQMVNILVTRLTMEPPSLSAFEIFEIKQALLASVLQALATYFIVLLNLKQIL